MGNPTDAELDVIVGSTQTVDSGEHSDKTYESILTNKPNYAAYPMTEEDQGGHLEAKKPAKRTKRQQIEKA